MLQSTAMGRATHDAVPAMWTSPGGAPIWRSTAAGSPELLLGGSAGSGVAGRWPCWSPCAKWQHLRRRSVKASGPCRAALSCRQEHAEPSATPREHYAFAFRPRSSLLESTRLSRVISLANVMPAQASAALVHKRCRRGAHTVQGRRQIRCRLPAVWAGRGWHSLYVWLPAIQHLNGRQCTYFCPAMLMTLLKGSKGPQPLTLAPAGEDCHVLS